MRHAAMVGLAALIACAPQGEPGADDEGTGEPPIEDLEQPEFLEPAGGEAMLTVDRDDDLEFAVRGIRPGLTRVILDEQSIGTATDDTGPVRLSSETITVRLAGAMVVGEHTLQLRTSGIDEMQESQEIRLRITAAPSSQLIASMEDAPRFEADVIDAMGHGHHGVLLGIDLLGDTVLATVAPAEGDGWRFADRVTLELPDFDRTDDPRFTVAAGLQQVEDTTRLRLAWRSGAEGRVMLGSDVLWPPASIQVQTVLDVSSAFEGFEYARLGRPLLLGDTLVMEALLATDVELPSPGARTLLTSHLDVETGRFGAAQRSAVGEGRDLDRIEAVRDLPTHMRGETPGLSARAAGIRAVVYEVDASTGTLSERPTGASDRFSVLRDANGPLHTVLGSLGARHVFVPLRDEEPSVFSRQFDDHPRGGSEDVSPGPGALEDLTDVTAPVTSTVIAGLPVFLVPQGTDAPVVAIVGDGPSPTVRALEGLACDEIAVPITPATIETNAVAVACRRGRAVHRGSIELDEET